MIVIDSNNISQVQDEMNRELLKLFPHLFRDTKDLLINKWSLKDPTFLNVQMSNNPLFFKLTERRLSKKQFIPYCEYFMQIIREYFPQYKGNKVGFYSYVLNFKDAESMIILEI